MQRRTFLQSTLASGGIAAVPAIAAGADEAAAKKPREFFELRTYFLNRDKQPVLDDFLRTAFIPALNRLGVKSVGVFYETPVPTSLAAYVLIPYQSLEQMSAVAANLAGDAAFQKAAAEYAAIPAAEPVYDRIESSLLMAFETMPVLEAPARKSRLFNLRIYESHSEAAGRKKIEMFNQGEIAIFRRVGLTPVLFGETIVGSRMPNLTYLLVFDDDTARAEAWNRFRTDPEWIKLKSIPEYEDKRIVSKITNRLLTPTDYSQI
jgi:hypothetical protein